MAAVSGTYTRYDAKGLRESLSDVIYNISPEDTPFLSGAGRGPRATQTLVEWQTDSLAVVDPNNAFVDGDEASFSTPVPTVRVGNYTQISRKTVIVADNLEVVDKAGRRSELAYQLAKRGAELKRDQEAIAVGNQGGTAGSASTPRKLASLSAWLKTNIDKASDGVDPDYVSGVPDKARTDGTPRAFTETILKNVIQSVWASGGNPRFLMVGPFNKAKVSGFSGIASRSFDMSNVSPKPTAIIASADVYVSDFGTLRVIPNRFQRDRDAFVLDWDLVSIRYLRPHRQVKLAKTGDAEKRMIITEWTLQVNQEAGLGAVFDLTTTA